MIEAEPNFELVVPTNISGNEGGLDVLHKQISAERNLEAVETLKSLGKHLEAVFQRRSGAERPEEGIGAWFVVHQRFLQFASTLPDARYLRVRSEDVLNDGRVQLRAIAALLGVRSDDAAVDAMLNPVASPFANPGPEGSGVAGGNDSKFLRDPAPREVELPGTVDPPPNRSQAPRVWTMVANLAKQLGYP